MAGVALAEVVFSREPRLLSCINGSLKDFDDLPKQLHLKLTIGLHRTLIAKCPLFYEFDSDTILRILYRLQPCTLPPETIVMRQGCQHTSMFWISRGMCWVIDISKRNADGTPHCDATLGDQEFFGDETVLSEEVVCAVRSVVTKSYCVLMERKSAGFDLAASGSSSHLAPHALAYSAFAYSDAT